MGEGNVLALLWCLVVRAMQAIKMYPAFENYFLGIIEEKECNLFMSIWQTKLMLLRPVLVK
jgi:hypothetical protein